MHSKPAQNGPKEYAEAIASYIASKDFDHDKLADIVGRMPPSTLTKILDVKPELSQFFEAEPALTKKWSALLKGDEKSSNKNNFFSEKIEAIDHHEQCTVLNQFLGLYYLQQWKQSQSNLANLDKACDLKIFDALVARCSINVKKIKKNEDDADNTIRNQLFQDIKTLSNLYWFPGTVHSALLLTDLASHFSKREEPEEAVISQIFFAAALELILTAKELAVVLLEDRASIGNKITRYIYEGMNLEKIYQGEGLKTITGGKFENWWQARDFFLNALHISSPETDSRFNEIAEHAYKRAHPQI